MVGLERGYGGSWLVFIFVTWVAYRAAFFLVGFSSDFPLEYIHRGGLLSFKGVYSLLVSVSTYVRSSLVQNLQQISGGPGYCSVYTSCRFLQSRKYSNTWLDIC